METPTDIEAAPTLLPILLLVEGHHFQRVNAKRLPLKGEVILLENARYEAHRYGEGLVADLRVIIIHLCPMNSRTFATWPYVIAA
jgi:hypothetical protein